MKLKNIIESVDSLNKLFEEKLPVKIGFEL